MENVSFLLVYIIHSNLLFLFIIYYY